MFQNLCLFDYGLCNIFHICTLSTLVQVLSVATKDETLHSEILYEKVTALRILFILLGFLAISLPACFVCHIWVVFQLLYFLPTMCNELAVLLNYFLCFQDQGYALAAGGPTFHTIEDLLRHYRDGTTTLQRLTRPYKGTP